MSETIQEVSRWRAELIAAGWSEVRWDMWRAPGGLLYRGPCGAWQRMRDAKKATQTTARMLTEGNDEA